MFSLHILLNKACLPKMRHYEEEVCTTFIEEGCRLCAFQPAIWFLYTGAWIVKFFYWPHSASAVYDSGEHRIAEWPKPVCGSSVDYWETDFDDMSICTIILSLAVKVRGTWRIKGKACQWWQNKAFAPCQIAISNVKNFSRCCRQSNKYLSMALCIFLF